MLRIAPYHTLPNPFTLFSTHTCTRSAKNPKAGGVSRVAYKALEAFVKRTILNASYMRDAWNSENSGAGSRYDEALYGGCGRKCGEVWGKC